MPFFPLGGFTPLQSAALETVARRLEASPMQVALAASALVLGPVELAELDRIGGSGELDPDL